MPSKPRVKTSLPRIRKFINRMPQLAFRGTTSDRVSSELIKDKAYLIVTPHLYFTTKAGLKGRTRDVVSRFYNSIEQALAHSFKYSGSGFSLGPNRELVFEKFKKLPCILFIAEPYKGRRNKDWNTKGAEGIASPGHVNVKGARMAGRFAYEENIAFSPKAKHFEVRITEEDLKDAARAWNRFPGKSNVPEHGLRHAASFFLNEFLVKRIVKKALPFLQQKQSL